MQLLFGLSVAVSGYNNKGAGGRSWYYLELINMMTGLKGLVQPEMKIYSLSTHPYGDGEVGWSVWVHFHCVLSLKVAKLEDDSSSDGPWMHLVGRYQQTLRLKMSRIWMLGRTETWVWCFFLLFYYVWRWFTNIFNCIGFGCNLVYPWNSKSVFWAQTLHPHLHWHRGE